MRVKSGTQGVPKRNGVAACGAADTKAREGGYEEKWMTARLVRELLRRPRRHLSAAVPTLWSRPVGGTDRCDGVLTFATESPPTVAAHYGQQTSGRSSALVITNLS